MINIFIIILLFDFNFCNTTKLISETPDQNQINKTNINYNSFNNSKYIPKKKNLILGIIEKYSLNDILPFFKSFIMADFYNCDVVMFVRHVSEQIINYLDSIGVFVFKIPEMYNNTKIINVRWKMYVDFLIDKKNEYNLVLHSDVGDTFFQNDVFKYYEDYDPFLGVAIEDETLKEKYNKKWIIDYAGEEKYKKIQNERVICVGQIWGTVDKFLEFSIIFWERLKSSRKSMEQGIGDYMFYYEKIFQDCLVKSDNFGPIMTIGLSKPSDIVFDSLNNILNFRGEIASVIHQYDRKPNVIRMVINKFCPEILNNKQERTNIVDSTITIKYKNIKNFSELNNNTNTQFNKMIENKNYDKNNNIFFN